MSDEKESKFIQIMTDFDGTLTLVPGSQLVSDRKFYESLQEPSTKSPYYNYADPLLPINNIKEKMRQNFFKTHNVDNRRITPDAVHFLKNLLSSSNIDIAIISRNHESYIKAALLIEGFSDAEIEKIVIKDLHYTQYGKDKVTKEYLKKCKKTKAIFIFDDDHTDANNMKNAALYYCRDVTLINVRPGEFKWETYLKSILKLTNELIDHRLTHDDRNYFKPINRKQAEDELNTKTIGEYIIRPSSEGENFFAVSVKMSDHLIKHILYYYKDEKFYDKTQRQVTSISADVRNMLHKSS